MSFGYSVGDCITVLKLVWDVSKALSESRGASAELKHLVSMFESLTKTIENAKKVADHWIREFPSLQHDDSFQALISECDLCRHHLQDFWDAKMRKYVPKLLVAPGGIPDMSKRDQIARHLMKLKWWMGHSGDIIDLERKLMYRVMAIHMYGTDLQWYVYIS